jgi:hypothetical protein
MALIWLVAAGGALLATALRQAFATAAPAAGWPQVAMVAAAPLAAALLVWSCLSMHRPADSLGPLGGTRVTLDAVDLPLAAGGAVRIGGDPQRDDLVVGASSSPSAPPRLASGAVRLVRGEGLAVSIEPAAMAVAMVGEDIVGARPLPAGWGVCALPCGSLSPAVRPLAGAVYDGGRFALAAPDGTIAPIAAGAMILGRPPPCDPGASAGRVILMIRDAGASATHRIAGKAQSLCVYGGPGPEVNPTPTVPPVNAGFGAEVICGLRLAPCQSVPLEGGRLAALPIDGAPLVSRVLCSIVGDCIRAPTPLRLTRLERLLVTDEGGSVVMAFPDPAQRLFTPAAAEGVTPGIRLGAGAALDQPVASAERPAAFERLGHAFDFVDQVLVDPPTRRAERPVVHAPAGLTGGTGSTVVVAPTAGGAAAKAVFDIRTLDFDHGLYGRMRLLAVLALCASMAATWSLRRADPLAAIVLGAVDLLLALRLVCAVEGAFMDGAPGVQAFPLNALPELVVGPLALLLAWPRAPDRWTGAGVLAACALVLAVVAGANPTFYLGASALAGLAALGLAAQTGAAGRGLAAIAAWGERRPLAWLTIWAVAMLLARLAFGFGLDWKEAAHFGPVRVAMSLLFVPAILIAFAPLAADLRRGGVTLRAPVRSVLVMAVVGMGLGIAAPSVVVKDFGFVIFAWPVATGLLVAYLARDQARATTADLLLAAGAAALALALVYLLALKANWTVLAVTAIATTSVLACLLARRPASLWAAPAIGVVLVSLLIGAVGAFGPLQNAAFGLREAIATDVNRDRLLAAFAPGEIESVGTSAAEAYANTLASMREYSHPLLGRGYLSAPAPTVLRAYQLTDNAAAIHLMSPFGRLGAVGLLMAAAAVSVAAVARALQAPGGFRPWLGALAALTPWLIDAYMILANDGAALFTGRNVYLLSPLSISDFIEALVLFGLVAITLGRPAAAAQPADDPAPNEPRADEPRTLAT